MTDLQDQILDRLVGAKVGKTWADGVLTIAAKVMQPKMEVAARDAGERRRQKQLANILGYPLILCEAIQGASGQFKDEEDRRNLGIAVIGAVNPPGGPMKRTRAAVALAAAAYAVMQAHPLVCARKCPLLQAVIDMMAAVERGDKKVPDPFDARSKIRCPACAGPLPPYLAVNSPPEHRAAAALRFLVGAYQARSPGIPCSDAARVSAQVVAVKRGVDAASKLCVEMARKLGL
jgi:hypothetical protein